MDLAGGTSSSAHVLVSAPWVPSELCPPLAFSSGRCRQRPGKEAGGRGALVRLAVLPLDLLSRRRECCEERRFRGDV